jgi:hypothetical protein
MEMRSLLFSVIIMVFSTGIAANEQTKTQTTATEKEMSTMRKELGPQAKRKSDAEVKALWDEKMQSAAKMAK